MAISVKKKALGIALLAGSLVAVTATFASATTQGQDIVKSLVHWSAGATDLNGKSIETKTTVTDTKPNDLGELQYEGSAKVSDGQGSGQLQEFGTGNVSK